MDLLDVMKPFVDFWVKVISVRITVGGYQISFASALVFLGVVTILIKFLRGMSE